MNTQQTFNNPNPWPAELPQLFAKYHSLKSELLTTDDWLIKGKSSSIDDIVGFIGFLSGISLVFILLFIIQVNNRTPDIYLALSVLTIILSVSINYFCFRHFRLRAKVFGRNHQTLEQFRSTFSNESLNELIRFFRDFAGHPGNLPLLELRKDFGDTIFKITDQYAFDLFANSGNENQTCLPLVLFNSIDFLFSDSEKSFSKDYFDILPSQVFTYESFLRMANEIKLRVEKDMQEQQLKQQLAAL